MLKVHALLDTLNATGIINHNYMHIKVLITEFFVSNFLPLLEFILIIYFGRNPFQVQYLRGNMIETQRYISVVATTDHQTIQ